MDERAMKANGRAKASSERSNASSSARAVLDRIASFTRRPVAARLAEPLLWCVALALTFRMHPEQARRMVEIGGLFLVLRLVCDTAPNLVVCGRLEEAPFSEHYVRRALLRVKLRLTLLFVLLAAWAVPHLLVDPRGSRSGDFLRAIEILALTMASYAIASPIVREHRGIPTARPSIGPSWGALVFALTTLIARPDLDGLVRIAVPSIIVGNVLGAGVQRYLAAASRLARPGFGISQAERDPSGHEAAVHDMHIVERALAVAPFLLLPLVPALSDFYSDARVLPECVLFAVTASALPPILFDAKRRARRFRLISYGLALILAASSFLFDAPGAARPVLDTAVLLVAYPPLNALLARGARRGVITALVLYVLAKTFLVLEFPDVAWPIAEALLAVMATAGALED